MGIASYLSTKRWQALAIVGLNNRSVDRQVLPVAGRWQDEVGCATGVLDLPRADYDRLIATPACAAYRKCPGVHSKPLEYLVSITLGEIGPGDKVLDAAGGANAEFLRAAREYLPHPIMPYSQDAQLEGSERDGIRFVAGSVDAIDLPDASFDVIACHHSIEHFRADIDSGFVREVSRLLKPGGRAVISPLFLADTYAEIWNRRPAAHFDPAATQIVDRSATFAGWGPYEGFARTYSIAAFRERLLASVPDDVEASVVAVQVDGRPEPRRENNRHAPLVNAEMKALVLRRSGTP